MTKKQLESKKLELEARERLQTSPLNLNKKKENPYGPPLTYTNSSAAN